MYSSSGDLFAFFDVHQNQGMPLWSLCALHKDILTSIPQEPSALTIPITSGPPETAVLIPPLLCATNTVTAACSKNTGTKDDASPECEKERESLR